MSEQRLEELQAVTGAPVSRETFARLLHFENEFGRWARKINLVAPSTLPQLWRRHIVDSTQLLRLAPHQTAWLDLGSGGGFPGAVLAILLADRPQASVTLVESNAKKAAFLRTILGTVGVNARIETARIEACEARERRFEIVTARALAGLPQLLALSEPWLAAGASALLHKGRDYQREVQESRDGWAYDLVVHESQVDPESVVLEIRNARRKV